MGAMGQVIPYKELVVPETSACIDGHPKISLHADHFKINKFYGPDDPSFKLVYPEIERMARGAQDILNHHRNPKAIPMDQSATSGDLRTCLQEMRVTNPRDILSEIWSQKGKRIGHTCEWILKREEFSAWGANDNSQLLRLIGSPGIGKTMMSTFLIEVLKGKVEKSPDKMFAYFLCDYRYPEQRSPTAVLRSLIWQLLLQRNGPGFLSIRVWIN
ncbi:Vegetative incompatibility protein HET-E-1 [Fusarium oxysporum f. sp. conglutinans]|nr:Vegetative incompatibility protein HET-E-1 [Fusarium oxysporum f. sp. conglutinans]